MNKLHPLVDFTLQGNHGEISAQIPSGFVDRAESTLVLEVDVGMVETFLAGVEYSSAEEILCRNTLTLVGAYAMPIADIDVEKPHRIAWEGNPHFLRQLRKPEFGAETVAFIVTQAGLSALEGLWPFDEIRFYR